MTYLYAKGRKLRAAPTMRPTIEMPKPDLEELLRREDPEPPTVRVPHMADKVTLPPESGWAS